MTIKACLFAVMATAAVAGIAAERIKGAEVFESKEVPVAVDPLDKQVFGKLKEMGVEPVLCSDAVFVRRAYVDITGTIPTADEVRAFLKDPDVVNKRRVLIDKLLETETYADYWAMKWSDVLRIKAEFPVNLWPNAAQSYHRWVRASIVENKRYDVFVRELLTSSGSNFRVSPVNFYRAVQNRTPEGIASAVALTLMGTRAEAWPAGQLAGMSVFFSQIGFKPTSEWKEEHVFWDPLGTSKDAGNIAPGRASAADIGKIPTDPAAAKEEPKKRTAARKEAAKKVPAFRVVPTVAKPAATALTASFPDGTSVTLSPDRDPREVFADWLIRAENPWFARAIVNRVWWWLMGRGIIHEPDDIRPDNPPCNPELLAALEKQFIADGYDLKKLYRRILNTQTYQLTSMPRVVTPEAEANFASYPLRRMEAEVLIDAINKITGTTDLYTSAIPEPYTYIPENQPAVAIADGSITSPFLALFGRSARATGMENERNNKPVSAQWLHMLNSSHIQRKLEQGPNLRKVVNSSRKPREMIEELYLTILSRYPTPEEFAMLDKIGEPRVIKNPAKAKQSKQAKAAKDSTEKQDTKQAKKNAAKAKEKAQQQPETITVYVKKPADWVDICWALINSSEFLYRH